VVLVSYFVSGGKVEQPSTEMLTFVPGVAK
jgi:hypothetical protein